jgi:hypothetical protein
MSRNTYYVVAILAALFGCSENKTGNGKEVDKTVGNPVAINNSNYLDFKFSKAVAFASLHPHTYAESFYETKRDLGNVRDTISRTLNVNETEYLNSILSGKQNKDTSLVKAVADCFTPRHTILFLDDKDSIINYIFVCFECNRVASSKSQQASMDNYREFFNSVGLKVFDRSDYHERYYDSQNRFKKNN